MIHINTQGVCIPALGFGTYKQTGTLCREAVATAVGCGYRHIDTASFYGNEVEVGLGIKDAGVERESLFVTTKVWRTDLRTKDVIRSVEDSLRDLGTSYLDLLLIHWPNPEVPLSETIEAMASLLHSGKVRALGGSNFTTQHLSEARQIAPIVCNQVEYHPFLDQTPLLHAMRRWDMALIAYAPLARGRVWDDEVIIDVARKHKKGAGQVALRWFLQQSRVGAVPKATGRDHISENFDIFDFELTNEDMSRISCLGRGQRLINPAWAPPWDSVE